MKVFIKNHLLEFQNRVDYVVDFINQHPSCKDSDVLPTDQSKFNIQVNYGGTEGSDSFYIPTQETIFSSEIQQTDKLISNKFRYQDQNLYSVELKEREERNFLEGKRFQFDIVETIFFHLSRYEEFHCPDEGKDRWDIMKEDTQFLVRQGLEKRPVVDLLVKCFLEAIGLEVHEQNSRVRITHDIDLITKFKSPLSFLRFNAYYLKNGRGVSSIMEVWKSYSRTLFKHEHPYDVFEEMLLDRPIDKEIYFLIGGKTAVDTPLDTSSDIFKRAIRLSKERGYRIGIHPSYATWQDLELFIKEKEKLEEIIGEDVMISRQHYLHFSFEKTIPILVKAGIKQDSTLGFNRRIGFRAGTGVGFKLYDLANDRATEVVEKPLAFMDSSLFEESGFEPIRFREIANDFLLRNQNDTELTFNFHNSRFDDAKMFGLPQEELYTQLTNG